MPAYKTKLIVNPNADLGRAWRRAADLRPIVNQFGGADWSGTVYPSHAIELARQAALEGYGLVVAVGGDGTVHEVVNGLMQVPAEQRPHLGIVPLGSGNDFAHAIGMSSDPGIALRQVLTGKPERIDIGRLSDDQGRVEYWNNAVGVGFDTIVTIHSRGFTYLRGFPVYFLAVLKTILLDHVAPNMRVRTDRENWSGPILMLTACNGPREGGGFLVAPEAKPGDGEFHYAGIGKVSRPMMLRLLPEVMRGTHGRFKAVRMGQLRRMEIESDGPLYIHTDGEIYSGLGMDIRRIQIELLPGAIEIVH